MALVTTLMLILHLLAHPRRVFVPLRTIVDRRVPGSDQFPTMARRHEAEELMPDVRGSHAADVTAPKEDPAETVFSANTLAMGIAVSEPQESCLRTGVGCPAYNGSSQLPAAEFFASSTHLGLARRLQNGRNITAISMDEAAPSYDKRLKRQAQTAFSFLKYNYAPFFGFKFFYSKAQIISLRRELAAVQAAGCYKKFDQDFRSYGVERYSPLAKDFMDDPFLNRVADLFFYESRNEIG